MDKTYTTFKTFYPFYLSQHENTTCRRLHFIGSLIVLLLIVITLFDQQWQRLWFVPLAGYGFAWLGHGIFEKNKPATFTYPVYSLLADWVMFKDIIVGKIKW